MSLVSREEDQSVSWIFIDSEACILAGRNSFGYGTSVTYLLVADHVTLITPVCNETIKRISILGALGDFHGRIGFYL